MADYTADSTILRFQKLTNLGWALTFSCVNIYARRVIRSLLPSPDKAITVNLLGSSDAWTLNQTDFRLNRSPVKSDEAELQQCKVPMRLCQEEME